MSAPAHPPVNLPASIALAVELERMRTERDDWKATADYYRQITDGKLAEAWDFGHNAGMNNAMSAGLREDVVNPYRAVAS